MVDINIEKQIAYWKDTARTDFDTAELLIENGKYLHGLFFCHLTIEKILKAHYVKANEKLAPKSHDLIYLADKSNLHLDNNQNITLVSLMKYQLEGRYPENLISSPDKEKTVEYLNSIKELLECLIKKL